MPIHNFEFSKRSCRSLLAIGTAAVVLVSSEPIEPSIEDISKVITVHEGDQLPLPFYARVSGWSLIVDDRYIPPEGERVKISVIGNPYSYVTFAHYGSIGMHGVSDTGQSIINLRPVADNPTPFVLYSIYESDGTSQEYTIKVQPNIYGDDGIMSEVPLSDVDIVSLKNVLDLYNSIAEVRIVQDHEDGLPPRATYDPKTNSATITSSAFTEPLYPQNGSKLLFHELAHEMVSRHIASTGVKPDFNIELARSAEKIANHAGYRMPIEFGLFSSPDKLEEEKLFQVLDESHYTDEEIVPGSSGTGHPYSNYDEMFASTFTVLHYYPEALLDELATLRRDELQLVYDYLIAIQKTIEHIYSTSDAEALQPHLAYIIVKIQESLDNIK